MTTVECTDAQYLTRLTDHLTACGVGGRDRLSFNSRRVVLRRDHVSGVLQNSYDNEIRDSRPTHSSSPFLAPCMFSMLYATYKMFSSVE
jgi:hypothetical protein